MGGGAETQRAGANSVLTMGAQVVKRKTVDRPSIEERVGRALVSNHLETSSSRTTDLDKVAALGMAGRRSPIGALFIRFLVAHDARAYEPLVRLLSAKCRSRFRERIVKLVIEELCKPQCRTCDGRGRIEAGAALVWACPTCQGVSVHRYSDGERASALGMRIRDYRALAAQSVKELHELVSIELSRVGLITRQKLFDTSPEMLECDSHTRRAPAGVGPEYPCHSRAPIAPSGVVHSVVSDVCGNNLAESET